MNRYAQAQANQILYGFRPQKLRNKGDKSLPTEDDQTFITRIEKAVTEQMIDDVLKSPIALQRLSGPIKKR